MGSREPTDEGEGPFYNNPLLEPVVKAFTKLPDPSGGCLERITKAGGMGLGMGFFYNLVAVPWHPDPVDFFPKGVMKLRDNWKFFRSGFVRPMAVFASVGIAFAGVECIMENARDPERKSKHWNAAAGGFASGMVIGSTTKRMDVALVAGGACGIVMGALQFNGMHYISDPHQMAMKVGGKWPKQYNESKELSALKEKFPEFKDL